MHSPHSSTADDLLTRSGIDAETVHAVLAARLDRLPVTRVHHRLLVLHGFGWLFDAMDVGLITFVLAAVARDWQLSTAQVGFIGSSGLMGMFVGAAIAGAVADRWGRKTVFQVTLLVFAFATLLNAFAWNVQSMVFFRFLVGVGLGGELPVVASLLTEIVPGKHRGRFIVWLESFWAFGWLAAALIAFLLIPKYGWRMAFVIGSLPALYVWVVRRKLPESPRWLASMGRPVEALAVVEDMERETQRRTLAPLPEPTVAPPQLHQGRQGARELWSHRYRMRTVMLWMLWFGLVFGYYGIFVWLPSLLVNQGHSVVRSFGYVVIITLAQVPGYFSAAWLIERIGRKAVIVSYLLLSAGAAVIFGGATSAPQIIVWGSLMSFFNLGAWGGVYAYTPEQYPTRIRTTGAGAAAAFGRIGGIIAPILVGFLLPTIGQRGVLVMNGALLSFAALSVAILGEETKGRTLEQLSG